MFFSLLTFLFFTFFFFFFNDTATTEIYTLSLHDALPISRIERDQVSPTVETLRSLLHLLGEDLQLGVVERNSGVDRSMIRERFRLTPTERVEYGRAFADYVIETRRANDRAEKAA